MRSFVVALIILGSVVFVTMCNTVYVGNRIDELLYVCEKLESGSSDLLTDELTSRWQNCRDIISLTTHRSEMERAESAILSLEHYLDVPSDYNTQLAILISILEHIKSAQSFSLDNIF